MYVVSNMKIEQFIGEYFKSVHENIAKNKRFIVPCNAVSYQME